MHGGSLMLPEVKAAMAGAEWGIVTCGSAAAVALGTAACVAGNDPVKMLRLPFTDGMVNRVLIPKTQRFAYDQTVRMIGCRLVEIDTRADLDRALAEPVAMVVLLGKQEHLGSLRLEEIASVVKPRDIPIMVDAASEHLQRPSPWLARGADLVVYSGGKFLRGPQTSGLLLGSKRLVQAAWANASPHQALGRPMKVSKEDIIGVLAAVEYWFEERDHAAERQQWYDDLAVITDRVSSVPGADGEVIEPGGVDRVPRLRVFWDCSQYPLDGIALRHRALEGEPRIMLDDNSATENSIAIDPFQLQPGEAAQIGDAIARLLREARSRRPAPAPAPVAEIAGNWELQVDCLHGSRLHRLNLDQRGSELWGQQQSALFEGPVSGNLSGDTVSFSFDQRYEGSTISYLFDGMVRDGGMSGTAMLGAASDQNHGIVNRSQFGSGRWHASRIG